MCLLALAGCGSAPAPAPAARPRVQVGTLAPPAGPDDVVVARVAGRPVWGSCVAAQARGRHVDARTALADCVDLEVAAQEAERRGLARDPDVLAETERALVARFVDREFSARYRSAAELPPSFVEPLMKQNAWRLHRPEYRGSYYARVDLDKQVAPGSPADAAAEQIVRAAYATLAGRKDLFPADLEQALRGAAGPTVKLTFASFPPTAGDNVQPWYRETLFAIPAIGTCAPPVRSPYGWDLVLWTSSLPAQEQSREQLLAQLDQPMRQRFFLAWAGEMAGGHTVAAAPAPVVERLLGGGAPAERAQRPGPPEGRR